MKRPKASTDEVKAKLSELSTKAKRSLGQNFLVNKEVINKIIQSVVLRKPQQLIEIGPGTGALTEELLKLGLPLTLIELDRQFAEFWRGRSITVIEDDALKVNFAKLGVGKTLLVSNLPYQISSTLLIDRSVNKDLVNDMILMFQKEVAQRIQAPHWTSDYGLLSVIAQTFWKVSRVCDANPSSFYPPPNVASRVLAFERKDPSEPLQRDVYLKFVKAAFAQRRKFLSKNLKAILNKATAEEKLIAEIESLGYSSKVRAEELKPTDFLALFRRLEKNIL